MRPCQHCGRAIGVKACWCAHCGREQSPTVGLTAPPLASAEDAGLPEPDAADDDDMMFYAAWRVAPLVTMSVGGLLGYFMAGITGMMVGALVMVLAAGVLLATLLGGPS
jgi:hypothetical protein